MRPIPALDALGWPRKKKNWIGLFVRPTRDLTSVGGTLIKKGTLCKITSYYRGAAIQELEQSSEHVPTHRSMARVRPYHLEIVYLTEQEANNGKG